MSSTTKSFVIARFKNASGTSSWRVSGWLAGVRFRKNFKSQEEARAEVSSLQIRALQASAGLRSGATFLTDVQLREAEDAFRRTAGRPKPLLFYLEHGLTTYREPAQPRTVAEATAEYLSIKLKALERTLISACQFRAIKGELNAFQCHFPKGVMAQFTPDVLTAYLERGTPSLKTYNNRRGVLSTFFKFAFQKDWIVANPVEKTPHHRINHRRGSAVTLSAQQAGELMTFLEGYENGSMVPYMALCLFAGIRPSPRDGEIARLTPGHTLELQNEDFNGYFGSGRIVTYPIDSTTGAVGRPTGFQIGTSSNHTADQGVTYGYDSYGRFSTLAGVSNGTSSQTFTYNYNSSNQHLIDSVTDSAASYSDAFTYDPSRDWVATRIDQNTVTGNGAGFFYTRDNLGRVQWVTKLGSVFSAYNGGNGISTSYGYNDRSEVTSEVTTAATSPYPTIAPRNDSYAYDPIGNRTSVTHNGATSNYTPNNLNQIDHRDVSGVFDVAGAYPAADTVTVTGTSGTTGTVVRNGQYFYDPWSLTNTSNPVFATLTVKDNGVSQTPTLPAYVAKTAESFGYDADGNLTSDGRWSYTYDAENRLITMETIPAAVTAGVTRQLLTFAYDYLGRRVSKVVQSGWNGSSYTSTDLSRRFIYNGWNLAAETNHQSSDAILRSYFWGLDLSGPGQGAGGVGALLMIQDSGTSYMPVYNALGNIYGLLNATSVTLGGTAFPAGSLVAVYEYDAFGKGLCEAGPYAAVNPFQYSTKYTDLETGLIYYGYRYYNPPTGRFINRDPIEETGGVNLYGFCLNNAVNSWDYLGHAQMTWQDGYDAWCYAQWHGIPGSTFQAMSQGDGSGGESSLSSSMTAAAADVQARNVAANQALANAMTASLGDTMGAAMMPVYNSNATSLNNALNQSYDGFVARAQATLDSAGNHGYQVAAASADAFYNSQYVAATSNIPAPNSATPSNQFSLDQSSTQPGTSTKEIDAIPATAVRQLTLSKGYFGLSWMAQAQFRIQIRGLDGNPLPQGIEVRESIAFGDSRALIALPIKTGAAPTNDYGVIGDDWRAYFWWPSGYVTVQQTLTVNGYSATLNGVLSADGTWTGDKTANFHKP